MSQIPKRILVVSLDEALRKTRVSMMESQGYEVVSVSADDRAMKLLDESVFDLVLLGRDALVLEKQLDQRVREVHPGMLVLKIQMEQDALSVYPSRTTHSVPKNVLDVVKEMFAAARVEVVLRP